MSNSQGQAAAESCALLAWFAVAAATLVGHGSQPAVLGPLCYALKAAVRLTALGNNQVCHPWRSIGTQCLSQTTVVFDEFHYRHCAAAATFADL